MGWVELIEAHRLILNENELDLRPMALARDGQLCDRDSSYT